MLFSSINFLFFFIPSVLLVYFIVPSKHRNIILFLVSLFFYAWGEPKYVFLMLFSTLSGYIFGLLIEKYRLTLLCRPLFIISSLISISLLMYFKYADFFIENLNSFSGLNISLLNLALPIGISFYTFQILSYTIDVYNGSVPAQRSFITLGSYISMFPQLIAGPIVRYSDVESELAHRNHTIEGFANGAFRFTIGLSKKILLANSFGELTTFFRASENKSVVFFWLYAVSFCLQIYFDFSGYSDMAIGLGKIFGFNFPENFNYPYISKSVTEFWRRWHITLGSWFRDYVYIPLGGNRVKFSRWIFNIAVVWFLTGFWHGASWTFIIWGLYFAIWLVIEKLFLAKVLEHTPYFIRHIYVLFVILLSFIIFNASNLTEALNDIRGLFGGYEFINSETVYYLRSYSIVLFLGIIGATPLLKWLLNKVSLPLLSIVKPFVITCLIIVCTSYLIDGSFNPFLYFRF